VSSSLVQLETSDPSTAVHIQHQGFGPVDSDPHPPILPEESSFRHRTWAHERQLIFAALKRTRASSRRLTAFANCGCGLWLQRMGDELVLTANNCHDRLCEICQLERRRRLIEAILCTMADARLPVRFVTLTMRHNDFPLNDQLDRLYHCFRLLRRRPFWRQHVTGGALFLEVKVGDDNRYHPHFHILCETEWLDTYHLSEEWHKVTGDSFRCDVRPVEDYKYRAKYVTKYATKPCDPSIVRNSQKLDEFVCAIKGRRLYQPFGKWKALLKDADSDPASPPLVPLASISQLAINAARGDTYAQRLWFAALRKWPGLSVFTPHPTYADSDPCPP